jgi:hypothetical protein
VKSKQIAFPCWLGFVAISTIVTSSICARADDETASVKKTEYSLFNLVPDAQLRDFSTDRPGKSHSSKTVDAGHFQIESDFIIYTRDPGEMIDQVLVAIALAHQYLSSVSRTRSTLK